MDEETAYISNVNAKAMSYAFIKKLFDLFVGLIGLVFLIPITVLVKILYICTGDLHSIFYSQMRIGRNGKEFRMYKFRSMVPNADKKLKKYLKENKEYRKEWDMYQKLDNDPRITKVGKLLRKTSIDEMPQFINLLKGDISLIGPRPLVPGEIEKHHGKENLYESVKPGITGWWAVNGRSDTKNIDSYKKRLELEYYYVEHQSLKLDLKIFFMTFSAVLHHDGAK